MEMLFALEFNLAGLAMFREGGEVLGKEPEDKAKKEALQMLLNLQQQVSLCNKWVLCPGSLCRRHRA
jgi:hypothetical protein